MLRFGSFLRRARWVLFWPCPFFARHTRLHRNFQFSPRIFDRFFVLSIIKINKVNAFNLRTLSSLGFSIMFLNYDFFWFAITLSTSKIYVVKKWCWFFQIHIFHPFLPCGSHFLLLSSHFAVITINRFKPSLFSMNQQTFPMWYFFPIQAPQELPRHVSPITIVLRSEPHTFRSRGTRDLKCVCLPRISSICVVEDVSIRLDILTVECWAIWERLQVYLLAILQ